jgi:peptidoglycan/LPS O-acetylase OafA/YrhL
VLNATFAFGAHDPAIWALLIGGWSLGIEFMYYLAFPLLLPVLRRKAGWLSLLGLLCLLQWGWIHQTVGSEAGYAARSVAYHQVPAFGAYFFGGCIIGHWRRSQDAQWPQAMGALAWLLMAALLLSLNPPEAGGELLGWRGAVLSCACVATVFASGQVAVGTKLAPVARWLGDITYGTYLLHPLFFFGFTWFVLPRISATGIGQAPLLVKCAVLAAVLVSACATAWASERGFEAPLRRWGKRVLRRPGPAAAAYREAASISS